MSDLDPRQLDLIHSDVDGEPVDADALEKLFAESPEALQLHRDLGRLSVMFEELEEVEPPGDLAASIMAAARRRSEPRSRFTWNPLSWLAPMPVRFAMTFVLGLVIGATALDLGSRYPVGDGPLTGSMAPAADRARIQFDSLAGTVTLNRTGTDLQLGFSLEALEPVGVVVHLDDGVTVSGFRQSGVSTKSLLIEPDRAALEIAGRHEFFLSLHRDERSDQAVRVAFVSKGETLTEVELRPGER